MRFDILSIFPELFLPVTAHGIIGRALKGGQIEINVVNIRDFGEGPHLMVDDRPYGGGNGMVMKPGPIFRALESVPRVEGERKVILLTPQGQLFNQALARDLSKLQQIVLVCGRYEGVDERIRSRCVDLELSVGDYILTGGELPAMIIVEVVSRLVPGVLGGLRSNREESFEDSVLEYPHFTRPRTFQGEGIPPVLVSGDHERIRLWRRAQSIRRTLERRPDLLEGAHLSQEDKGILEELQEEKPSERN